MKMAWNLRVLGVANVTKWTVIQIAPEEVVTIVEHLGNDDDDDDNDNDIDTSMDIDTFRKKYARAEITPANGDQLQSWMNLKRNKETGSCVFLNSSSGKCGIYDARPVQCRTYPFWPSLLEDEEAWKDEFVLPDDGIIEEGSGDRYWSAELGGCEGISIGNRNAVGTGIGQIINAVAKVPEADVKNVDMD